MTDTATLADALRAAADTLDPPAPAPAQPDHDPMDVAYLAIGAVESWDAATDAQRDELCGQDNYIATVIAAAPVLAAIYESLGEDGFHHGCWYYEVSEAAGAVIGRDLLAGEYNGDPATAEAIARRIISAIVDSRQ